MSERLPVRAEADVAAVARAAREAALAAGFGSTKAVQFATAASEVATNALVHAGGGEAEIRADERGVEIAVRDRGPGIDDLRLALRDGWSSAEGLGLGLPGARRLADRFDVRRRPGGGTEVVLSRLHAPPAPEPATIEHAVTRRGSEWIALAEVSGREEWLAVLRASDERRVRDALGGGLLGLGVPVAAAAFHPLDGRIGWLAAGGTRAALLRSRRRRARVVATPPPGGRRAGATPVLRDDLLVLASGAVELGHDDQLDPHALAEALLDRMPAAGLVLVARFARGAGEIRAS